MGCGGSRPNAEGEAIPAKLHPMLRRRIEEVRRRRHSNRGKSTTTNPPHGPELLLRRDGKAIDDEDEIENSMASCVTSEHSKGSTAERAEVGESAKEKTNAAKGNNVDAGSLNDANEKDESRDSKDDEGLRGDENSILFPGSPSFRIYFTGKLDEDEDDDDAKDGGKREIGENEKTSRDQSMPPEKDLQDSDPKKLKKGRKRSSSRKGMPKGGQNAMKNLFNVRACYIPSCSSHNHVHLTEKTPA